MITPLDKGLVAAAILCLAAIAFILLREIFRND
jgi:hypothetical protein